MIMYQRNPIYDLLVLQRCAGSESARVQASERSGSAQVLFGTADGQVIVMDCHGRMLAHILLHEAEGISSMAWNYPPFLVQDSSESDTDSDECTAPQGN